MQTVIENIEIAAEERVLRALVANLEDEHTLDGARGMNCAAAEPLRERLNDERNAIEGMIMGMEPRTAAMGTVKAMISVARTDLLVGDVDWEGRAEPPELTALLRPIFRAAEACLTGEDAHRVRVVSSWYVDAP